MKNLRWALASCVAVAAMSASALAWDGVNINTGEAITIAAGTAIAEGSSIQFLDDKNQKHTATVSAITLTDDAIELQLIDDTSGDTQTYDFDPSDAPAELELPDQPQ